MKYAELFRALHPDFFSSPQIRAIAPDRVLFEQVLDLHAFSPEALEISVPESITFGLYEGPLAPLHEAVARVGDYWVPCYDGKNPAFCACDGKRSSASAWWRIWAGIRGCTSAGRAAWARCRNTVAIRSV